MSEGAETPPDGTERQTSRQTPRAPKKPYERPAFRFERVFNARLARRTRDSVRHWAAMFKCPKDEDLARWSLPRALFFLYYPLRVGRLTMKYARRLY